MIYKAEIFFLVKSAWFNSIKSLTPDYMLVRTHIEVLWSTLTLHIKPVLQAHLGTKNETKQKAALQDYNLARAPNLSRGVFGILVHRRQYQQ